MKTAAVICELNPFHNGHALLFRKLREEYGADYIIAIMSGNYVQRGEPAVCDKYLRAEMALRGGHADLVIELPPVFASSSAHDFAMAGVKLAAATGIVNMLGFGMEAPASIDQLSEYARRLDILESGDKTSDNGSDILRLRKHLSSGMSYPAALSAISGSDILAPNNILAVEYLRALQNSSENHDCSASPDRIRPVGILREGDRYHDTEIHDAALASATALRNRMRPFRDESIEESDTDEKKLLHKKKPSFPFSSVPAPLHPLYCRLLDAGCLIYPDDLSVLLSERILAAALFEGKDQFPSVSGKCSLSEYLDVSEDIAQRLINRALYPMSFQKRIEDTKTRQYTYSRISRALLHIALGITKEETARLKEKGYAEYIRILGFRRDAAMLLHELKEHAALPVISKAADHKELLRRDLYFDQIYYSLQTAITADKKSAEVKSELLRSPVVV